MTRDELLVRADWHQERGEVEAALACLLCAASVGIRVGGWWADAVVPGVLRAGRCGTGERYVWYARHGWIDTAPPSGFVHDALAEALRLVLAARE